MNVYFVLSEELMTQAGCYEPPEPPEYGCICLMVRAETNSQARYLAWKTDRSFDGDLSEMPAFVTRKLGAEDGPKAVLSDEEAGPWWDVLAKLEDEKGRIQAPRPR